MLNRTSLSKIAPRVVFHQHRKSALKYGKVSLTLSFYYYNHHHSSLRSVDQQTLLKRGMCTFIHPRTSFRIFHSHKRTFRIQRKGKEREKETIVRWKSRPKPFVSRRRALSLGGDVCEGSSSGFLNAPNVKKRFLCCTLHP